MSISIDVAGQHYYIEAHNKRVAVLIATGSRAIDKIQSPRNSFNFHCLSEVDTTVRIEN